MSKTMPKDIRNLVYISYFSIKIFSLHLSLFINTIYFRHTFITKLYRELRSQYGKAETHDRLMLITGHTTLKALTQYLRDIDAELPEDYSEYLK